MPIYMQVEGVKGDCTTAGFMGWFELGSAMLGVTTRRNAVGTVGRGGGNPGVSEINVTTALGSGAARLFELSLKGPGKKVVIAFVDKDGRTYLKITMEDTLISSFQVGGSGGGSDQPMVSMTLNFAKITYEAMTTEQGKAVLQKSGWDLRTGQSF